MSWRGPLQTAATRSKRHASKSDSWRSSNCAQRAGSPVQPPARSAGHVRRAGQARTGIPVARIDRNAEFTLRRLAAHDLQRSSGRAMVLE
jgi:hypothetical protein